MSNTENLRDTLLVKRTNGYDRVSGAEAAQLNEYCEGYKVFLNRAKTEREAAEAAISAFPLRATASSRLPSSSLTT